MGKSSFVEEEIERVIVIDRIEVFWMILVVVGELCFVCFFWWIEIDFWEVGVGGGWFRVSRVRIV